MGMPSISDVGREVVAFSTWGPVVTAVSIYCAGGSGVGVLFEYFGV
jgi:hypothetical protein